MRTIEEHAQALADGSTTSRALVEQCLARIADPDGEGARAFIKVHAEQARAMADAMDMLRRAGREPSRYAGIPVSLKDLFDIAGEATPAGSRVLADAPPATAHAPVVQRMLAAGFVPVGRTNMTEFAFSGLGINPHYGTPRSPWDRATRRIPGGSSSGTAVSVSDGMAVAGLGTDTGGSCRIPAAFCGIVGYKPTARRVPITGVLPLAPSFDSVGTAGAQRRVLCGDRRGAGRRDTGAAGAGRSDGLRLARSEQRRARRDGRDVSSAFDRGARRAVARRRAHQRMRLPRVRRSRRGECQGWLRRVRSLCVAPHAAGARRATGYDPRIRMRIARGERMTAVGLPGTGRRPPTADRQPSTQARANSMR